MHRTCALLTLTALCITQCSTPPAHGPHPADAWTADTEVHEDVSTPEVSGGCEPPYMSTGSGVCIQVGPVGCAAPFLASNTGWCDPRPNDCGPGELFSLREGCVAVGLVDCHPDLFDAEVGLCDPDPSRCPEGSIPIAAEGCVSMDPPGGCGDGTWGAIEERPLDVHVDPHYTGAESDGSREAPFTTLLEGAAAVQVSSALSEGGRVVLAAGEYPDELTIDAVSFEIVGRCASMVTLTGDTEAIGWPDHFATITITGPGGLTLRDVTIQSNQVGLVVQGGQAGAGGSLFAERVIVRGTVGAGVLAQGEGTQTACHQCHITGARKLPEDFPSSGVRAGFGVQVRHGAGLVMERSLVEESASIGLFIEDPETTATVRDTVLSRGGNYGAQIKEDATAHFERSAVLDTPGGGIIAIDPGTAVTMANSMVRRVTPREVNPGEHFAIGVAMAKGSLTMNHSVVADLPGPALYVGGHGAQADLRDMLLRRLPTSDVDMVLPPAGMVTYEGAAVTIERMSVLEHEGFALVVNRAQCDASYLYFAMGSGVSPTMRWTGGVIARDANVTVTQSVLADSEGAGITVYGGGHLTMSGSRVARWSGDTGARSQGISVLGFDFTEAGPTRPDTETSLLVMDSVIDSVIGTGAEIINGDLQLARTLIVNTGLSDDVSGDSVLALGGSIFLQQCQLSAGQRVGIIADRSEVFVVDSRIDHHSVGTATMGDGSLQTDEKTDISNNALDHQEQTTLAIPDAPTDVPPPPSEFPGT